jgi:hypothetical protein
MVAQIDLVRIQEEPVDRISRKIREDYWDELTRTIDKKGLAQILQDEKTTSEVPTLYISAKDKLGITYFQDLEKSLKILKLKFCPRIYRGIRSYFKYKAWTSSIRFSSKLNSTQEFLCSSRRAIQ